ncbi:hypothetical protein [Sanguibacter antarcticus]|uniref:Uncharacterized protein n=1 Tax=Sanguibacter antarcticus TaxID=372484 RepID=A0A2A9E7I4_9MICO|nr:hypothetical protein [Sanguibacter antarcticus]PFG34130.1 hypothetical protein ATL42_2033 [Sanguibacter antarcticus]
MVVLSHPHARLPVPNVRSRFGATLVASGLRVVRSGRVVSRSAGPSDRGGKPSRAASVVPLLLSLAGLVGLGLGAAYLSRDLVEFMAGLLSST